MTFSRRHFGIATLTTLAFAGFSRFAHAQETYVNEVPGYGPLRPDPAGLLDLPDGFSYRIVSRSGDVMSDGFHAPGNFDGMGCFAAGDGKVALVRNHELTLNDAGWSRSAAGRSAALQDRLGKSLHFGHDPQGRPVPGGTTTLIVDLASAKRESEFLSLTGTSTNCAGGATPWGSWLTCEEAVVKAPDSSQSHGWVFEVPSSHRGLVTPVPLTDMGRYRHEAAAVDPATGIVYLTEDRDDGLFYRFLPHRKGELAKGGRLQALAWADSALPTDSRNWDGLDLTPRTTRPVRWIDMDGTDSPEDDLRQRGNAKGAVRFARGEGMHLAVEADGRTAVYVTCTNGGPKKLGQVMRYFVSPHEGAAGEMSQPGQLEIFVESSDSRIFEYGDNLTVSPQGHVIVCEDRATDERNHLRGIAPSGRIYTLGRLNADTELAGVCFSPDGESMFVNAYHPGITFMIRGPWTRYQV